MCVWGGILNRVTMLKSLPTVGMDSHLGGRDIGGDAEIRNPQILNLAGFEDILNAFVKAATWKIYKRQRKIAGTTMEN